ncbi:MAG: hypothetical protein HY816_08870 [Candidatus Wallbacteria bacterium]|nr:hypothetical protein [Candidatus Wallbacteria bacterium]
MLLLFVSATPLQAQPDLSVGSIASPTATVVGASISIESEVFNGGTTTSAAYRIVLSLQPEPPTSTSMPVELIRVNRPALLSFSPDFTTSVVDVPDDLTVGNYRVLLTIDLQGGADSNLSNNSNTSLTTMTVSLAQASVPLHPGLNLVALPIKPEDPLDSAGLADAVGSPYIARFVTGGDGRGRLQTEVRGMPGEQTFQLEGNRGYFLLSGSSGSLLISGRPWPPAMLSVSVPAGHSAIAFPRGVPAGQSASDLAGLASSPKVSRVEPVGGRGRLVPHLPGLTSPYLLQSGKGYVVSVPSARTLSLPEGP